jgi:AraC-like DNA-binding protein
MSYKSGGESARHSHPFAQFVLCLKGRFAMPDAAGRANALLPGEALLFMPGVPHSWAACGPAKTFQVSLDAGAELDLHGLGRLFSAASAAPLKASMPEADFETFEARALRRLDSRAEGAPAALWALVLETLALFAASLPPGTEEGRDLVGAARELALSRPGASPTLEELAAACGLGTSRYSQLFRELAGESPMAYVRRLRMERAAALLRCTSLSVGALAGTLGYSSIHYFSAAFKSFHGVSPEAFRSAAPLFIDRKKSQTRRKRS